MNEGDRTLPPLIELRGVVKRFGALEVLRGIDLCIHAGETVAVIGPSGSGKSTLVRCLNHLEPIQGGTIVADGYEITADGVRNRGRRLRGREIAAFRTTFGMVFQQFNLFPHRTVIGNLLEAPTGVQRRPKSEVRLEALDLLRKVGLEDKADAYPSTLSGGQQQRVAIARSLLMHPKVMLFDEPTSALDPELTGEVLSVISALAIRGRTSIIVTHELSFAAEVADRIIFMDGGRIVEQGHPRAMLRAPREPRTQAFLSRLLRPNLHPAEEPVMRETQPYPAEHATIMPAAGCKPS
jgi:polar amino acid transport system ATP-binding protein